MRSIPMNWLVITGGYFVLHYTGELIHAQIIGQNFYVDFLVTGIKRERCSVDQHYIDH